MARRMRKLIGKQMWFKDKQQPNPEVQIGNNPRKKEISRTVLQKEETETVVFIPCTPGSVLKSRIAKIEEEMNFKGRLKYGTAESFPFHKFNSFHHIRNPHATDPKKLSYAKKVIDTNKLIQELLH